MILGIPNISIVFAMIFLMCFYVEFCAGARGIVVGVGLLFNLAALVILFMSGADYGAALLLILTEIVICFAITRTTEISHHAEIESDCVAAAATEIKQEAKENSDVI